MLHIFLDANIIIDFMARREYFYKEAAIIVSLAINLKSADNKFCGSVC